MARSFQEEQVLLKFNNRLLDDTTLMREINDHGDNLIAMEAVKRSDWPARAPRQPLQPSNAQVPAKPTSSVSGPVKSSPEAESRYASPCAPRPGTPATSIAPGSVVSDSNGSQRRGPLGYNSLMNRLPSKSPLSERSRNPWRDEEGRHELVKHHPDIIPGWDATLGTVVAKARTNMAKDPVHNVENLPAPVKPNLAALAHHDNALRERLKQQLPWKSDGMTSISDELALD